MIVETNNQMACNDGGIMRESEFIRRVAEAESVIRYTFRLEIPEAEQRLKGDLVACSLNQAYRMTGSLFSNYWKNRPFHINDPRKELFEVKRQKLLSDAAVPELYCMVRKIIGEENTMTVYAAGEYAFFDAKAFDMGSEADDILSNFVTGMDDLFNRRIYTFENDQSLTVNKKKLEVKGLGEKLGSRNQPLKKTVNNVDTKLATLLPAYQSFFFEEKNIADPKKKWKSNLKISDLDLMIILKRSSKKLDILRTIQEARQDHTTLSMLQIQKLQRLHKELTSFCEQRYDDKDQKKHLTTVELEHLTAADKLYIQMEIERITNCTMLADLLKNIREFPGDRTDVMFADPASIMLFSRCFELGNIYNRTEVLDRSFQGFQDSLMLVKNSSLFMMDTLGSGVQRSLKGMNIDTIDVSYFEQWKKVYEEEMDCWSNWIFPIFTSCFCVVLSKNIKEEQSNLKKNDAKEVSIMYKELSDYINKNNLKMSAMTFDDELLSNARKNSIMRNMISDYLMDALQEKRRLPIPITLKEVNEIMPKRSVGKGLKEARI